MAKSDKVDGMEISGDGVCNCSACQKGKQMQKVIPHSTQEQVTEVLGQVFSDMCSPMETSTVEGFHYFITFTNDYSQFTYVSFCKTKDNALAAFKTWKACAEKETGKSLKILCTDGGGEYTSTAFNSFLAECGIKCKTTNAYTPQENRVSKHGNCTINTLAQSLQRKFLKRKPYLWLYGPSLSHTLYGSKTMSSLTPLNPPIPHSMFTLARSQISSQSVYLAVKPTSMFQKSTSLNSVNTQLNVFMSVLHWKRVPTCSIIGSRGTFSNPKMSSLKNPWIEVKLMSTLIVTLTTLMALVIQRGDQRLWITKRN